MTDFSGGIFNLENANAYSAPQYKNVPAALSGAATFKDMVGWSDGPKTEIVPAPMLAKRALAGNIERTFFDDYYNRIWLIPVVANLGAVTADSSFPFYIWNAYLVPITETSVVATGSMDQVSVAGPPDPFVFQPLRLQAYTLVVAGKGAAVINGNEVFTFSNGDTASLTVKGSRAFLWDYEFWPNWNDIVTVSYAFKTEIIPSRFNYEQRRGLRQTPRKTIEFTSTFLDNDKKRKFRRLMQRGQNLTFIMPEFPRRANLAADAAIGDNTIVVESVPDWLVINCQIVLANYGVAEVSQVQSITGTTLTLATQLANAYPNGAAVISGVVGRLDDKISGRLLASFASEHKVAFKGYPGEEGAAAFSAGVAGTLFDGREIMPWRPNWLRDPSLDIIWPVEEVDAEVGLTSRFPVIPFPSGVFKATFLNLTPAQQDAMRQFHQRMLGALGEFFVPTFENDLADLRQIAPAGTNLLRIIGTDVYAMAHSSLVHKAVVARMNDGTLHPFKVQSVLEVDDTLGNDTLIEFTTSLPVDIGGPDTSTIDWLFLSRFATDTLSIGYETITISQVDMSFQMLPYAEAE